VKEIPLTLNLIYRLLYTLLPSPLRIFEVCSSALVLEPSLEEPPVEDFVAIIRWDREGLPLIILRDETSKTLSILNSKTVDLASLRTSWLIGPR
jgi:hypothetical protein